MAKAIPLTQGFVVWVDDDDYDALAKYRWMVMRHGRYCYAARNGTRHGDRRDPPIWMHRVITNAPSGMQVDHADGDGLNNRKSNLRVCTRNQNQHNGRRPDNNKSGYKGVRPRYSRWSAQITHNTRIIHLGTFDTPEAAANAYDAAALKLFGSFARLNNVGG